MSLAQFILANIEPILVEWEHFARSIPAAHGMDATALRDHARQILTRVAADMAEPQTATEQKEKSWGHGPHPTQETAAEQHATHRESEGFDLREMMSEYRALRASVLRLWSRSTPSIGPEAIEELTRFNEAVDEAMAGSIGRFNQELGRSRELLLGVLGHDLRNPLGAMVGAAGYLRMAGGLSPDQERALDNITRSAARLEGIIGDLLDVTRTRLGQTLPLERAPMDLAPLCAQIVEEARAHHRNRSIALAVTGDLTGRWDGSRIGQMLSNLIGNAIQHGAGREPVKVSATGAESTVALAVHNDGKPIPESMRQRMFEPMIGDCTNEAARGGSLGLGLYIACEIAKAHRGQIEVDSTEQGTTFTVRLPRNP